MTGREAATWVLTVCSALRLSQTKTLADLVAAALSVGRASLAAIGRKIVGDGADKHKIKRTWRFCAARLAVSPREETRWLGVCGSSSRMTRIISARPAARRDFVSNGVVPVSSS